MRETFVILCAMLMLALAACGGSDMPMAVVNGEEITIDHLIDLDPAYEEIGQFESADLVDDLGLYVLLTAIETTARDQYGIDVGDDEVDAAIGAPGEDYAAFVASLQDARDRGDITEGQLRANVKSLLVRFAVFDALVDDGEAIQALIDGNPEQFTSGCIRWIVVASEEEAVAAAGRIDAGEAFTDVADEVSLDTSSEGGLLVNPSTGECEFPFNISPVPELGYQAAIAPLGEVIGPIPSESGGWYLIVVEERTGPPSVSDVQADPDTYLSEAARTELITPWLNAAIDGAVIEVDPTIGTWSDVASAIVPAGDG